MTINHNKVSRKSNSCQINFHAHKLIHIALITKGMTNYQLANRLGIHESYLSHIIAGRRHPKKILRSISRILGIDYKELIIGRNSRDSKNKEKAFTRRAKRAAEG